MSRYRIHFSDADRGLILKLAEGLTGASHKGGHRLEALVANVVQRMMAVGCDSLASYLQRVERDQSERGQLISALTIHTTYWFREQPHFDRLAEEVRDQWSGHLKGRPLRIWCAGCSTGQEVWSFALVLEHFRSKHLGFEYEIIGTDVDPVSVNAARAAVYSDKGISDIPRQYHPYILRGSGRTAGFMTIDPAVRQRCRFLVDDLTRPIMGRHERFHVVICRNVLIYFAADVVERIIDTMCQRVAPGGLLVTGHSETFRMDGRQLARLGHTSYRVHGTGSTAPGKPAVALAEEKPSLVAVPKILVIDDSKPVRAVLEKALRNAGFICDSVESAEAASAAVQREIYSLVTLDLGLPGIDGATWLKSMRAKGFSLPVVVISDTSRTAASAELEVLGSGVDDFFEKAGLSADCQELTQRIDQIILSRQAAARTEPASRAVTSRPKPRTRLVRPDVIVLGASTGGTEALSMLLKSMPADSPPVLAVQHITPSFIAAFAQRLAQVSGLKTGGIRPGTPLERGHLYMALDSHHIGLRAAGGRLEITQAARRAGETHCPSVNHLFLSAAASGARCMAFLLTGMGDDGARGLLALRQAGAMTAIQDQASCVVFGMPKAAAELGAADFCGNLEELRALLLGAIATRALDSSAPFTWSSRYSIGIPVVDEQHRQLVDILHDLYQAMRDGRANQDITQIFARLFAYTRGHFAMEEQLQRQHGYPDADAHSRIHHALVKRLETLSAECSRTGMVNDDTMMFLVKWLQEHIMHHDMEFGRFVRMRQAAA